MKLHQISGSPPPALAHALAEFELPFTYPLGPGKFFRITHGEDYTLFFRAIGDETCFIAENEGRIAGVLGTAVRQLWMPDGTERAAAYIGDLKIAAAARGGTVLIRLARAAEARLRPKVKAAFGVVMDGTAQTPGAYTGRAGIPVFQNLSQLMVLRILVNKDCIKNNPGHFQTTRQAGLACYQRLSRGHFACPVGDARQRSEITPVWLMKPDGSACGMLEDTRKAKRLITGDGSELRSAHLSCFASNAVPAAAELIRVALGQVTALGLPALFVAVARPEAQALREALHPCEVLAAPATVYGAGLEPGSWNINSSEI
ncbi:MAG: N-acetyltransferase [Pedosphaera sp.]|nr:N-acetyltransferase [Pedosphaera sp.]